MNRDYCGVLYTVGHIILFLVKQLRTKKKKPIYYRIYDIWKLKKSKTSLYHFWKWKNSQYPSCSSYSDQCSKILVGLLLCKLLVKKLASDDKLVEDIFFIQFSNFSWPRTVLWFTWKKKNKTTKQQNMSICCFLAALRIF